MSLTTELAKMSQNLGIVMEIVNPTTQSGDQITWYCADTAYRTRSTDDPADVNFTPCIESIPRHSIQLREPGNPRASVGFGTVRLSTAVLSYRNNNGGYTYGTSDIRTAIYPGATVTVKWVGKRKYYAYSEAITIFTAVLEGVESDEDDGAILRLTSGGNQKLDHYLTGLRVYGRVLNVTPTLTDFATLTYSLNGGAAVEAINGVYDRAVELDYPSPAEYTPNLASGTLALTAEPEQLTVDVDGGKLSGVWAESTKDIVELILDQFGINITLSSDWNLSTNRIGYALEGTKRLTDVLDELAATHLGFWYLDDSGELTMKKWDNGDVSASISYDQDHVFAYRWAQQDKAYLPSTYTLYYGKNWTPGQAPAAGADSTQAEFAAGEYENSVSSSTSGSTGSNEIAAPPQKTLFAANPSGQIALWATLFAFRSRRYTVTVPLDSPRQLGDQIQFWTEEGDKVGFCMGRTITIGESVPVQTLELLV